MNVNIPQFRVWHKDLEKFLSSDEWCINFAGKLCFVDLSGVTDNYLVEVNEDLYVIQQFTGLLDNNKNKIFDGDIVEHRWIGDWEKGVIVYWFGEFRACNINSYLEKSHLKKSSIGNMWYQSLTSALTAGPKVQFRVIGNVFENPDLISVEV